MAKVFLLLIWALAALGSDYGYVVVREASPSGATEAVTIQQPASGARTVRMVGAYVYCSGGCSFTIERNGAPATETESAPVPLLPTAPLSQARGFVASNAGPGTVIGSYAVPPGGYHSVDLSSVSIPAIPGANVSVRTGTTTGNVKIVMQFSEVGR